MEKITRKDIGAKIRLMTGYDEVYHLATAGSLAKIVDFDVDSYGYDKIKVRWDREDWRYNGEHDCWTFPEHFQVTEAAPNIEDIATEPDHSYGERMEAYIDSVGKAFEEASGAEGFMLITVQREPTLFNSAVEKLIPIVMSASMTDEGHAMLERALMHMPSVLARLEYE